MNTGLRWQTGLIALLLIVFTYLTFSNFATKQERMESPLLPDEGLRWGLDLQGGIHWVVGVDLDTAIVRELEYVRGSLEEDLKEAAPVLLAVEEQKLVIEAASEADVEKHREAVEDTGVLSEVETVGLRVEYVLTPDWEDEIRRRTMDQVLEVLRRRIDDPVRGIPDSVVTKQGEDRVLVQIPGGQIDRSRARELLKSTGFLEFKIVLDQADSEELLRARFKEGVPEDQTIAFERDKETGRVLRAYLVRKTPDITGDYLEDARMGFDRQQRPLVNFTFNPEGGSKFGELTENNLRMPLGIILDDNVYSAPIIQSRITTRGQITGRFTSQEAADLAVVLRAGSLAVPVVIEEERTIGPALGQDSIDSGVEASLLGLVLIIAFVCGYYRLSGGYASFALLANLVLLIGLMSLFEATLTLPGIAGLVLTIGMAVDANVIIFERIREELTTGKTPRAAIGAGFEKATSAVIDANLTTLFTALILFEYGTGPIKGFAVTLSVGILTSVFAALVVTRLLFQIYPGSRPVEQLSI